MKHMVSIFVLACLLLGCSPQFAPTATPEPTQTPLPSKTATATVKPTMVLSPTPPATWTPAPTPIPDTDCTDAETFVPGIGIHRDDSGLARLGNGKLFGVGWSPDGTRIAVGSETGIYIFDATNMQQVNYIETPHDVEVVRFSPNGKWLATDDYSQVAVWNVETGELVAKFGDQIGFHSVRWVFPFSAEMGNISFHPNGSQVALHSMHYSGMDSSPSVEIWDIQTQKLVREWKAGEKDFFVPDAIFSPDGKRVASPWKDGVAIWDAENGEVLKHIPSESRNLYFSPDGQKLVMPVSNIVRVLDLQSGASISVYPGNTYEFVTGIISADGAKLITHYTQNKQPYVTPISIWSLASGDKLLDLNLPDFVLGMALNPMRNELVTVGYAKDHTQNIRVWDIETGTLLREDLFSQHIASKLALSTDGSRLIVEKDNRFHMYNAHTGGYLCMLQEPIEQAYHLSFRADGKKLAYINPRKNAIIWDLETGKAEQIITPEQVRSQNEPANSLLSYKTTVFKNGPWNLIAWGWKNAQGGVNAWIINTCDATSSIPSDCPGAISPNRKFTIAGTLVIQDTDTQKILHTLDDRGATNFTFTPDGLHILLLNYLDWTISVWDAKTYQKVATINSGMEGEGPILGNQEFSFSTDGIRLATYLPYFHKDGIRIWNTKTWKMEKSFDTKGGVGDVAISGDGKRVAALSGYVIYLWHLDDTP